MGIIGEELLSKIEESEKLDHWEWTLELLALAQLEAVKNFTVKVRELANDSKVD